MRIFRTLSVSLKSALAVGLISFFIPAHLVAQSADETKLIARAEQAISDLITLKATFIQVSSDGSLGEGRVYFRRPHQLRLDYENPATLSIVTSRVWVYVDDKIDKFVQALPVSETPFFP
ncbi:MAG: LolA family protein, partial [Candidatus Puniceispirillaceae bacterium]